MNRPKQLLRATAAVAIALAALCALTTGASAVQLRSWSFDTTQQDWDESVPFAPDQPNCPQDEGWIGWDSSTGSPSPGTLAFHVRSPPGEFSYQCGLYARSGLVAVGGGSVTAGFTRRTVLSTGNSRTFDEGVGVRFFDSSRAEISFQPVHSTTSVGGGWSRTSGTVPTPPGTAYVAAYAYWNLEVDVTGLGGAFYRQFIDNVTLDS